MKIDKDFAIKTLTFYDYLEKKQQKLLLDNISGISYKKGELLLSPLTECTGVLMVKTGSLKVYIISEDGRKITLYKLENGGFCALSASCILQSIPYSIYIEAMEDTEVYVLNISIFSKLIKNNIRVENFALNSAVSKFSTIISGMEKILFASIDNRLSDFLIKETEKNRDSTINITHEEIAGFIGSAREVVSRTLKSFANKGLIEQKRGQIKILNKKALENFL